MSAVATQTHDYEPGIQSNGVFWTVPVSPSSVKADLKKGTASFALSDYKINDYTDFAKSLTGAVTAPAVVTFDLEVAASPKQRTYEQVDKANGFRGRFTEGGIASITWSSKQDGFEFHSDAAKTSTSLFSIVGSERNGVFFNEASAQAAPTGPSVPTLPATGGRNAVVAAGAAALLGGLLARRLRVAAEAEGSPQS